MTARQTRGHVATCAECGWASRPSTAGLAAHALRLHSCGKHRAELATAERGRARDAAVDRRPATCTHPVARHQHGTRVMYTLDGCRCVACAVAASQYEQERQRAIAYGRSGLTASEPVRAHLERLAAAGIGLKRVATVSGVAASTLAKVVRGSRRPDGTHRPPATRVRVATASAVLAVGAEHAAGGARVDATGTRRRLQALAALGWSTARIASDFAVDRQALDGALHGRDRVFARTAATVRAAFEAIGDRPAPSLTHHEKAAASRTLHRAAAAGWAPPAAWDPEQFDDPTVEPPAPSAWSAIPRRASLDLDEWANLVAAGEEPRRAARRCGVSWSAVEAAIARTGHARAARVLREWRAVG